MYAHEEMDQKLTAALKAAEDARASRTAWIMYLLLAGFLGGSWFAGHQGQAGYALGYEAGRLSTAEGQAAAAEKILDDQKHLSCDANGRNCVNR